LIAICVLLEHTGGGSRFGYHWFIERGEAGPILSITWVPSTVLKTNDRAIYTSKPATRAASPAHRTRFRDAMTPPAMHEHTWCVWPS
jgi:hypothetical protein